MITRKHRSSSLNGGVCGFRKCLMFVPLFALLEHLKNYGKDWKKQKGQNWIITVWKPLKVTHSFCFAVQERIQWERSVFKNLKHNWGSSVWPAGSRKARRRQDKQGETHKSHKPFDLVDCRPIRFTTHFRDCSDITEAHWRCLPKSWDRTGY